MRMPSGSCAEDQLPLRALERRTRLIAQVVHADEELAHHDHHEITALRREGQLVGVIDGEGARCAHERHLDGQPRLDRAAEVAPELPLVESEAEQLHHEPIAHAIVLRERGLAHHGHAAAFDGGVVIVHGERVHVQVRPQVRDAARPDGGILLVIDHVLVDHGVLTRGGGAAAVERPRAAVLEQARFALGPGRAAPCGKRARQKLADDLVVALLAIVIDLADGARQRFLHARARHQRVERSLAGSRLDDALDVANEDVLRSARGS